MATPRQAVDRILSPIEMADDAGVSKQTWYRRYRHDPRLKIIEVSDRRIGARESNWRDVIDSQVERKRG